MTDWSVWSTCPVTCGTGIQSRARSCNYNGSNITATARDDGCAAGFQNGYHEEQDCSMPSCRKFLLHLCHVCHKLKLCRN